ncbi:protein NETWORKED 4B-like [Vicia villosa]|uniref:protein NETWORKED 4B-like n=1 Tax=Vicia villosa TaxID=3911 RepID=UPI00273CEEA3|nr:protein NETWORKED 4B-like [Vicia villosa]XP_058722480.1 protein NETWORKED 4B-like [Vicia villosa]
MEGSGDFSEGLDQERSVVTPYFTPYLKKVKPDSDLQAVNLDFSPSSGGVSSDVSVKEGSGSPSSPSLESEPESFTKSEIRIQGTPVNTDDEETPEGKLREDTPNMERQSEFLGDGENKSYDELLKKFIKNEEELRVSNLKLQLSEQEIIKLKNQIEKRENQLDNVLKELELNKDELEYKKGQVQKLQIQTAELETHVSDYCSKIANLEEQLEVANEHLKISNDDTARLRNELENRSFETHQLQGQLEAAHENVAKLEWQLDSGEKQIRELEDGVACFKANETNHQHEMQRVKEEMLEMQAQFSLEKVQLHSDITSLSELKMDLTSKLEELERRHNSLENKLRQGEAENLEQKELYATQQLVIQSQISSLKEELRQRKDDVETVNKEFDGHKQKFDMLMTERDEANAMIDKLKAEITFRDDQIENMKKELFQLSTQQLELKLKVEKQNVVISDLNEEKRGALTLVDELKLKVEKQNVVISDLNEEKRGALTLVDELKLKLEKQNVEISVRNEEKREAIRQLCFSLDHYKSKYDELLQAFTGHRRHTVIAS